MPLPSRKSWGDICLAVCCILYASLLYGGAQDIPPAFFDLLGSAAVPIGCAAIILLLALLLLWQIRRNAGRAKATEVTEEMPDTVIRMRWDLAAGIVVLTSAYVAVMNFGWLGFDWATAAFVLLAILLLGGIRRSTLLIGLVLAGFLGFGGQYIFTEVFFIDLPV